MLNQGKLGARAGVFAGALVVLALLACKKSSSEATPTASPVPETPPPAATPEAPKEPEPAASTAPTTPTTPTAVATTTKLPLDAGVLPKDAGATKDAGTADAAVDAGKPAGNPAADAKAVEACCGALAAESKKAGPHSNKYKSAAAVCSGIAASVKKGAADAASAKTTIRAQLTGVPIPGGC